MRPRVAAPSEKKRVYVKNTVMHVEQGGQFYMLNGASALGVLRLLLAFLLHNKLLGHAFVFFVDGNSFYSSVVRYFSWYSNLSVILDWYSILKFFSLAIRAVLIFQVLHSIEATHNHGVAFG